MQQLLHYRLLLLISLHLVLYSPSLFPHSRHLYFLDLFPYLFGETGNLPILSLFFFNDTATTEIHTLSLHDALPISVRLSGWRGATTAARASRTSRRWTARAGWRSPGSCCSTGTTCGAVISESISSSRSQVS